VSYLKFTAGLMHNDFGSDLEPRFHKEPFVAYKNTILGKLLNSMENDYFIIMIYVLWVAIISQKKKVLHF
jgi:hypothetical protein